MKIRQTLLSLVLCATMAGTLPGVNVFADEVPPAGETVTQESTQESAQEQETPVESAETFEEPAEAPDEQEAEEPSAPVLDPQKAAEIEKADFSSKRIIVGTEGEILHPDNVLSSYDGVYLLQFDTEEEARNAYMEYDGKVDLLDIDSWSSLFQIQWGVVEYDPSKIRQLKLRQQLHIRAYKKLSIRSGALIIDR